MRIFLDSSILIEYIKGNHTELLELIIEKEFDSCINHIVYSEFMFHFLSLMSGKSPLTLKTSNQIKEVLIESEPISFIENFKILEMNHDILLESYIFMKKYNLLPNDALIFATCKYYDIALIASLDKDFIKICQEEKIILIKNKTDIRKIKKT